MKACVTGVAGFLGSHVAEELVLRGHAVVGVDSMLGGSLDNVPPGVDFHPIDCCSLSGMKKAFAGCEVVWHLAAAPHEGLSVFSPCVVTRNTYLSTVSVATAAAHCGVRRVVFTSSLSRYGANHTMAPFSEDDGCAPVDPYGIAKAASEDLLLMMGDAHGFEVVIAVPHNVYGPRQRYFDPYRNVVGIFINRMLQGLPPIIYGDGAQVRCFSYVDDCVPPVVEMGFKDGLGGKVINVGPDAGAVTVSALAVMLRDIIGYDGEPPIHLDDRPCEVKVAWASADRARRLLGYRALMPLEDGLWRTVGWVKARGTRPFDYHLPVELPGSPRLPRTWKERLY